LPGIILETNSFNLLIATARFVLSMNCEHHSANRESDNDLICTGCSPNRACGQPVNNAKPPVKSTRSHFANANYSQLFLAKNGRGEQVSSGALQKKSRSTGIFLRRRVFMSLDAFESEWWKMSRPIFTSAINASTVIFAERLRRKISPATTRVVMPGLKNNRRHRKNLLVVAKQSTVVARKRFLTMGTASNKPKRPHPFALTLCGCSVSP
jgi:hypothetical protein